MADVMVECPLGPCPICNESGMVKLENVQRAQEPASWEPTLWEPALCLACEGMAAAVTTCPCGCNAKVCEDCAAGLAVTDVALTRLWQMATQDWENHGHG